MDKKIILEGAIHHIEKKIDLVLDEINSINASIGNETKSSAGDKFETSREMMNQEIQRMENQLTLLQSQLHTIEGYSLKPDKRVGLGSLVELNKVSVVLGAAIGKLLIDNKEIHFISVSSPIGQNLLGKSLGDSIVVSGTIEKILSIL